MSKASDKKKAKGTGLTDNEKAWAKAAAATPKDKQTKIAVDMRDVVRISAEHEVPRPMSREALLLASGKAAREHNRIKAIEAEIEDFKNGKRMVHGEEKPSRRDEIKSLKETSSKLDREIEAEAHLILTPCIELHDVNRGIVTIYLDDHGEPGEKVEERRMTPEERKKAGESPFSPPEGEGFTVETGDDGDADVAADMRAAAGDAP